VELALAGLRAFAADIPALLDASGLDPEYRISGVLRVALTDADAAALRQAATWQANAHLDLRWLDPGQVAALEPGLVASHGGLLSPREGHINPPRLVASLAAAAARSGAIIHEQSAAPLPWVEGGRIRGLLVDGQRVEAGRVVLAAGAWSAAWAEAIGVRVPVRPVKGQMILLRTLQPPVRHVIFAGHGYFVPRVDGTVYVGATVEEAGFDRRVTVSGVHELTETAAGIVPTLRDAELVRAHAGLRPGCVDGLPVLGPAPGVEGLILAAGHFRNGILMSLITGRLVHALATGQTPELPLDAFLADRFAAATR
jgi:glycine oxidase